jgi:hypothetical protein
MKALRSLGIAAAAALALPLSGCLTTANDLRDVSRDPARALVIGWGTTVGEALQNAISLPSGVRVESLFVAQANGVSVDGNVARLDPGKYELTITCGLYREGGSATPRNSILRSDLSAGRVYFLRARSQSATCSPYLEDVTDMVGK